MEIKEHLIKIKKLITEKLTLPCFKARIGLIYYIDSSFASNQTAIFMPRSDGFQRIYNFHQKAPFRSPY
jgi:hypothetical protein